MDLNIKVKNKQQLLGLEGRSVGESTDRVCRGHRFYSQHLHGVSETAITLVLGAPTPFLPP